MSKKSKLYQFDHKDLKRNSRSELFEAKKICETVLPTIDSAINPGLCIYWAGKLEKIDKLLKSKK